MSSALPDSRRAAILERVGRDGDVKISSLAQELGVSAITVRRDLARLAGENLIEQVRGGARRLAAPAGRSSTGTTHQASAENRAQASIAMVTPALQYYWPTVVAGARRAAARADARLLVQASSATAADNLSVLEELAEDSTIDALIFVPDLSAGTVSERLVERLQKMPLPVVLVERSIRALGRHSRTFDSVRTDHASGAAMALRHLADLGHERVALLSDPFSPTRPLLEDGFTRTRADLGFAESPEDIGTIDTHGPSPFEAIDGFLHRCSSHGTTAALVHSDEAALLVLQHAQRRGWTIPQDLSIISYDDELSDLSNPPLTAVAPPREALGERAIGLALQRLHSPEAPIERVELLPAVTLRSTTAPPPGRSA